MGIPYAEVIGDPVAHSKSPLIHKFWLEKLGIEGDYRATRVTVDELPDYLAARRADPDWRGCNVTMPLKEEVLRLADWVDERTSTIGAVNCLWQQEGRIGATNTDFWGLLWTLGLFEAKDPVIVIGSGGAARATLEYLDGLNACEVHIICRDRRKGARLLNQFGLYGEAWTFAQEPDIGFGMRLINATPLGMRGQPAMPFTVLALIERLDRDAGVLDMVYDPPETPLLAAARRRDLMTANGLGMLVGQASQAFEFFFGAKSPGPLDDSDLWELLTR